MKTRVLVWCMVAATGMMYNQAQAVESSAQPVYQVAVVQTAAKAINYRNLKGSVKIDFKGTVLLPDAKGEASIRNKSGVMEIQAEFKNLTPATQFGVEYLTYILWAISPDGRATNLGELIVKNGASKMEAKTSLQAMSLLVTAEPYFAVSQPSNVVILENAIKADNKEKIELVDARYDLLPRGQYIKNVSATDIQPLAMDKKTPFVVYQARNAVRIAKAAGAETYAADGFKNAARLLALAETKEGGNKGRMMTAREAVQSAEDSRSLALQRQIDEARTNERRLTEARVSAAQSEAAAATMSRTKAEDAQAKAEQAKQQADAERVAALALANSAVGSSVEAQAEAKAARAAAEKSAQQQSIAATRAQTAEDEKAAMRAQLKQQLNAILQTQDTARGLIVNMADALFQTGSAELRPPVREKLAKVAGIVSSHPDLKLSVEGHTDSVGAEGYNLQLSEKRAQAVQEYLVSQGLQATAIASRGFGETKPIDSNDTSTGRQKNRRVEIVVSGETIGTLATAQ